MLRSLVGSEMCIRDSSMTSESKDTLPCHLALVLKIPFSEDNPMNDMMNDLKLSYNKDEVVGHVKIARADGRSDGACCISYSLVVDDKFRGLGFGRILTEKAEERAKSLGLSYIYLSTNDMVNLYFIS